MGYVSLPEGIFIGSRDAEDVFFCAWQDCDSKCFIEPTKVEYIDTMQHSFFLFQGTIG